MDTSRTIEQLEPRRLMAVGDLDPNFGDAGITTVAAPDANVEPRQLFQLDDGRFVLAGSQDFDRPYLRRFLAGGAADTSFPHAALEALIEQRIGTPVAYAEDGRDGVLVRSETGVVRVQASGNFARLDPDFGKRGATQFPFSFNREGGIRSLVVLGDGRIAATGVVEVIDSYEPEGAVVQWGMVMLAPNGRIDSDFGDAGVVRLGQLSNDRDLQEGRSAYNNVFREELFPLSRGRVLYLRHIAHHDSFSAAEDDADSWGGRVINPDGTTDDSFVFDRTNVLAAARALFDGEGESRDGLLTEGGAWKLPDGSVRVVFIRGPATAGDPNDAFAVRILPDGTVTEVVPLAEPWGRLLRDPQNGSILIEQMERTIDRLTESGGNGGAGFTLAGEVPGDSFGLPTIVTDDAAIVGTRVGAAGLVLVKVQASEAPTGLFAATPIRAERAAAARFTVTWQGHGAPIDVASLAVGRSIVVDLPDGSTRTAVLESTAPGNDADTVVATYHVVAPAGSWDAADSGAYTVRVRGRHVADTAGRRAIGRTLGRFFVAIPPPAPVPGDPGDDFPDDGGIVEDRSVIDLIERNEDY